MKSILGIDIESYEELPSLLLSNNSFLIAAMGKMFCSSPLKYDLIDDMLIVYETKSGAIKNIILEWVMQIIISYSSQRKDMGKAYLHKFLVLMGNSPLNREILISIVTLISDGSLELLLPVFIKYSIQNSELFIEFGNLLLKEFCLHKNSVEVYGEFVDCLRKFTKEGQNITIVIQLLDLYLCTSFDTMTVRNELKNNEDYFKKLYDIWYSTHQVSKLPICNKFITSSRKV